MERLSEVHNKEDEKMTNDFTDSNLIENHNLLLKDNLTFKYGGKYSSLVLDELNFTIPENKVTAIVGPSGSGKTTLIKLLLKFYEPTSGTIYLGDTKLCDVNTNMWRRNCGVVMQDGFIFADTILKNITESDSESVLDKKRLKDAVHIANIESFIESLPLGYNTRIGSAGINISGGQRQRILIARAVYKNPKFLFFDEATSSLDANNEKVIMQNLERFFMNRTVVVVAHRLSTVKNADQILVLDKGKIIEVGTHKELTKQKQSYYHLVKNQLELGT